MAALSIIVTLLVPLIGGLTWLAYNHPRTFRRIAGYLHICILGLAACYGALLWSYVAGMNRVYRAAPQDISLEVMELGLPSPVLVSAGAFGLVVLIVLLQSIHKLRD